MIQKTTNWTEYYQRTPKYTSLTRQVSSRRIVNLLAANSAGRKLTICELGGANSCFVSAIFSKLRVDRYHVVDLNDFGLQLLQKKEISGLTFECSDVLTPYDGDQHYDVVYSVGLIEHFDVPNTARAISSHFDRCKPGGLVLITFPTPTMLYRVIRGFAEATGNWAFPDERPLRFPEVLKACEQRGETIHRSINWWIGLTQGYVLIRSSGG